jgi:Protein of unknown function (DUF3300)
VTIALMILLSSFFTRSLQAQRPPPEPPQPPARNAPQRLAPEALNQLLAPIALYPDALIALILPASTVPSDVVLAARYLSSNGDPGQVANQPWDDSVKSLTRYPDVLAWMDQNLEWTSALGEAFLNQPADVMNSVQGLRAEAKATGNLRDTPQQQVVEEKTYIRIVPAQPEVIYVPQYDPDVVFVQPYSQNYGPPLTFGAGFAVGSWLTYDFDWDRRNIYVGQWRPGWNHDRNWNRGDQGGNTNIVNVININNDTARRWQPSTNSLRQQAYHQQRNPSPARIANVNALDGKHSPVGPSTSNVVTGANALANQVPRPSRPDFTNRGDGRNRRHLQDLKGAKTSPGIPPAPNADSNTSGLTNVPPGAQDKNHKVPVPTTGPSIQGEQGQLSHSDGQGSVAPNLGKHAQSSDQSKGGTNNRPTTAPSTVQSIATPEKHEKNVGPSEGSFEPSNKSPQSSNGQKDQHEHAPQSTPSLAERTKTPQTPSAVAHQDQPSQASSGTSEEQSRASQPSKGSHGKGKSDEKKSEEKKDKGDN